MWLTEVLGFTEVLRFTVPDGAMVGHVELARDNTILMLGPAGETWGQTSSITLVFVDDVDAACARATSLGGTVEQAPVDKPFGLRQAVVVDAEHQRWELSQLPSRRARSGLGRGAARADAGLRFRS